MGMSSGGDNNGMMAEINVTPFVDVMLVLLIIFMVTAPMMNQGVQVQLPKAARNNSPLMKRHSSSVFHKKVNTLWLKKAMN